MKEKFIKYVLNKLLKLFASLWGKTDGKKTYFGIAQIVVGILFFLVNYVEIGIALITAGLEQLTVGLAHKAHKVTIPSVKKNKKRK